MTNSASTIGAILATMAVVAVIETIIPLHARGRWSRAHLRPNLALTFITFGTNLVLSTGLVGMLAWLQSRGIGLLPPLGFHPLIAGTLVVLVLDFAFYVTHVAMHRVPSLWRYHRVHHSDPAVDVTTTIRQHPGESVIRYAFMGAFAITIGAGPGPFAVYRAWSALNGLFEHADVRVPRWLDDLLSLVTTWPNMHKVHHSRVATETNTNYGNIVSFWDRLFSTFTPARRGTDIVYGLDGFDDPSTQTTVGLLALPFRDPETSPGSAVVLRRAS